MMMNGEGNAPAGFDPNGDLTGFANFLSGNTQPQAPVSQPQMMQSAPQRQFEATPAQQFAFDQQRQQQNQLPPMPEIVIPEGRMLAGRYRNLDDLERHATHFQSVADRTRNEAREALEIKGMLDEDPAAYDVLADYFERRNNWQAGPDLTQAIVTGEDGTPRLNQEVLGGYIEAEVQRRVAPLERGFRTVEQTTQERQLQEYYQANGIDPREIELDRQYSQQLATLPPHELLMRARALRTGQQGANPFGNAQPIQNSQPQIPRTVTNMGGYRAPAVDANQAQVNAIVDQGGRRSFQTLFNQHTMR